MVGWWDGEKSCNTEKMVSKRSIVFSLRTERRDFCMYEDFLATLILGGTVCNTTQFYENR